MHPNSLSPVRLFVTPWTVALQGSSVHGDFSRQIYCRGLLFPPAGDLSNPGIKFRSPALQADAFPSEPFIFFPLSEQILNAVVRAQVETSFVMSSEIQQMYQDRQSQFFFLIPHHSGKPRVLGRQCPEVLRDVCHALHGKINICFLRSYHLLKHQPLVSCCHPGNPALLHPGALPLGCWRWGLRFEVCRAQVFSGL